MKSLYNSPEFETIKMDFDIAMCTGFTPSAETVVEGEEEFMDGDP